MHDVVCGWLSVMGALCFSAGKGVHTLATAQNYIVDISVSLSICLSVCVLVCPLSDYLSVYLYVLCLSVCLCLSALLVCL